MRGVRLLRSVLALTALIGGVVVLAPGQASATVSAPCTATVAGVDVTKDHDSAGTSVHIDYQSTVPYQGTASGQTVASAKVHLQLQDLSLRTFPAKTNGSEWTATADVKKYAWAGIGLYHVKGETFGAGSTPICSGMAYICVDGKSPFTTVAGIVGAVLGAGALFLILRGLFVRRSRSRGEMTGRFAVSGLLGGLAAPILLQQFCILPLTQVTGGIILGAGIVGLGALGALIGGGKAAAMAPVSATQAATPPVVAPIVPRRDEEEAVYRFSPPADACNACRSHAEHKTYRTAAAAEGNRAHPGCHCEIVSTPSQKGEIEAKFAGGRSVHDDRG
jgi:hypothetical protein